MMRGVCGVRACVCCDVWLGVWCVRFAGHVCMVSGMVCECGERYICVGCGLCLNKHGWHVVYTCGGCVYVCLCVHVRMGTYVVVLKSPVPE